MLDQVPFVITTNPPLQRFPFRVLRAGTSSTTFIEKEVKCEAPPQVKVYILIIQLSRLKEREGKKSGARISKFQSKQGPEGKEVRRSGLKREQGQEKSGSKREQRHKKAKTMWLHAERISGLACIIPETSRFFFANRPVLEK